MYSIVIPAFNEDEKIISNTISRCIKVMQQSDFKFEIILIDDGSDQKIELKNKHLRVLTHPHNVGYGKSLKDGIYSSKFDTIIITDADGTYPIEEIPNIINTYNNQNFDMVVGARQGKHYDESTKKKILRLILKFLVEYTAGRKIPDINSGLRVFSKNKILPYFKYLCNTFSFTTSLTLAYMMNGYYVKYIPINYEVRSGKSKVNMFRDSLRTMQFIVEAMLYYNPIKVFFALVSFLILSGLISLITYLLAEFNIVFLIIAITFFSLGVISISLALISIQVKQTINVNDNKIDK